MRDGKSDVLTPEYFFSDDHNLVSEYYSFLSELNTSQGQLIACQFPARYTWIRKHEPVPEFDLKECSELKTFIDSFDSDSMSLVLSSETMGAPSSAFGHVLLLFPSKDGFLPPSSVVHYSALPTRQDGFLDYVSNGISGKYPGFYIREPFFKKMNEYGNLEQRFMHIYPMNYSPDEVRFIQYHLFELRKAEFKYFFFQENCSYRLDEILNLNSGKAPARDLLYTLPVSTLKRQKANLRTPELLIPGSVKTRLLLEKMKAAEKKDFQMVLQGQVARPSMSNLTKQALVEFATFKFRSEGKVLTQYREIQKYIYPDEKLKAIAPDPVTRSGPSKVAVGLVQDSFGQGVRLLFRPVNNELIDPQLSTSQETELSLMKGDLIFRESTIELNRLDFVSLKLLEKGFTGHRPLSWSFLSGINRDNETYRQAFENEMGFGQTSSFQHLTLAPSVNMGFDLFQNHSEGYLSPQLTALYYLNPKLKLGSQVKAKTWFKETYVHASQFLSFQMGAVISTLEYVRTTGELQERSGFLVGYTF